MLTLSLEGPPLSRCKPDRMRRASANIARLAPPFFHDRCVATANFEPLWFRASRASSVLLLTLLRFCADEPDDRY